jgi:hypothetical protein
MLQQTQLHLQLKLIQLQSVEAVQEALDKDLVDQVELRELMVQIQFFHQ